MRKKTIFQLFFLLAVLSSLWCCRNEDFATENPSQQSSNMSAAKFASKSFWKEDEVYIRKVQQVFLREANLENVKNRYGELYWDYAMSFGQFGESYLLVPVVKNNKVVLLMEAVRIGDKVHFYQKEDRGLIDFFHAAIFSNIISYDEKTDPQTGASSRNTPTFVCSTRWITIGCTNNEPNCTPYTTSETICKWTPGTTPKTFDPIGMDDGGGGGNGYEYPDPPEIEDPCTKLKTQNTNSDFKAKVKELDKEEVLKKNEETGIAAAYGPQISYEPLANTSNDNLKFPPGNKYFGYIHTHLDSKEGVVKIFSPADVSTFLTSCVRNAHEKGTMTDAYGMVITSQGNYILKYSGDGNYGIGPGTLKSWNSWYDREYQNLLENGGLSQPEVEKLFTRFLEEKVKLDGLEVYKSDKTTGNTSKLQYDGKDSPVKPIPCP